jgi:hypothetical protein
MQLSSMGVSIVARGQPKPALATWEKKGVDPEHDKREKQKADCKSNQQPNWQLQASNIGDDPSETAILPNIMAY